jgi:hypothetical protein
MTNNKLLDEFFCGTFEEEITEKMMNRKYIFEKEKVIAYIMNLLAIDFNNYIYYSNENYNVQYLTAEDVIQFSNFDDATISICNLIKDAGDNGYGLVELGKMLENDGVERTVGTYRKYGENQAKTAESLGLLHSIKSTFYLTCIGYAMDMLSDNDQQRLICRLIMRNKLIRRLIYKAYKESLAEYFDEVGFLSYSTMIRRRSNTKQLLKKIKAECDDTNLAVLMKISFD